MRRRARGQKLYLAPTLDPKKADRLKSEKLVEESSKRLGNDSEQNNGNIEEDLTNKDFNADYMPNITKWKEIPLEHWNEQQLGLSALSPPESESEAFKSLRLLLATNRNEYVDTLLPVLESPRHTTEQQWLVPFSFRGCGGVFNNHYHCLNFCALGSSMLLKCWISQRKPMQPSTS